MIAPGFLVVARRVLRQLRRDKRTLALIIIQPILVIGIFGYSFGGEIVGAKVAVANLDRGVLGGYIVEKLNRTTLVVVPVASDQDALAALKRGDVTAGIVIPANYTDNYDAVGRGEDAHAVIVAYEDKTNPQVTNAVLGAIGDSVTDAVRKRTGAVSGIGIEEHAIYGEPYQKTREQLDFLVPGVAAFTIFQMGSLLTVVTIVKERTLGTLPRVMASPIRRWEVVLGYTLAFLVLSLLQATSVLLVATVLFGVSLHGNFAVAIVVTTLVGLVALAFGILVSGVARNEFQAVQSVFLITFPNMFLAGIFAPIESMPGFLRPVTSVVPLTYAVRALRATINHGRGIVDILPELAVLAAFGAAFLAIATISFGRKG